MNERRAHPRIKGPFEGWWDGSSRQAGRLVDLSMGGCFVESVQFPSKGQIVVISITVQGGEINVPAEVLYSEVNQGFAVRFVDMPEGVADLLRKELDRKLRG